MKMHDSPIEEDLLPEYDPEIFADGVRGKYAQGYNPDCKVVKLDADVAAAYPSSEAVNRALRELMNNAPSVQQ